MRLCPPHFGSVCLMTDIECAHVSWHTWSLVILKLLISAVKSFGSMRLQMKINRRNFEFKQPRQNYLKFIILCISQCDAPGGRGDQGNSDRKPFSHQMQSDSQFYPQDGDSDTILILLLEKVHIQFSYRCFRNPLVWPSFPTGVSH